MRVERHIDKQLLPFFLAFFILLLLVLDKLENIFKLAVKWGEGGEVAAVVDQIILHVLHEILYSNYLVQD